MSSMLEQAIVDAAALKALNKVGQLPAPPKGWSPTMDKVLIPFKADSGR